MSFAAKFLEKDGGRIRLITAKENGRDAWFVLVLNEESYTNYKEALRQPSMNIRDFGKILQCGWGKPPAELVKRYAG